jgi:ribulose-phosphate 3-epimerase
VIRIAPSILSADFARLGEEVAAVERAGADLLHVDVMDGHFVPNLTIGPPVVDAVKRVTSLDLDVHLMIEKPWLLLKAFADAGAASITVHLEACPDLPDTIARIRKVGARAAVSLNPETPIAQLEAHLPLVEMVLVMSVHPGFGGQAFIPESLEKVATLVRWRDELGLDFAIEIDGGIKQHNAARVAAAGADILVAGSAIFGGGDYRAKIADMRRAAEEGRAAAAPGRAERRSG